MTPSGQYVAFQAEAGDLVDNDTSAPQTNVFASPIFAATAPVATSIAATAGTPQSATVSTRSPPHFR